MSTELVSMSRSSTKRRTQSSFRGALRTTSAVWDYGLTMPEAARDSGDEKLAELFAEFKGHMVSPGGAAQLLGLSRKTIYTLCKRGELRAFRSDEYAGRYSPRWVYIPIVDI